MIRATFQLTPGIGPWKERALWSAGITSWDRLGDAPSGSPKVDARLREAIARAEEALAAGDAEALAAMLPRRERWRLYAAFADEAAFLDIETDAFQQITAIGVLDRDGPRLFLRDRNLHEFPEVARWPLLVTYNGLSFDAPALERAFPGWRAPLAHVDLRHLFGRLGHGGGLKLLEEETGVGRPPHLKGVDGREAIRLWSRHEGEGDRAALRALAEYNLYDAVNLKALAAIGYNRMLERLRLPGAPVARWERGDVLYDVTRLVLAL